MSTRSHNIIASLSLSTLLICPAFSLAQQAPIRLDQALDLPEGFHIGLQHRSRFENLVDNVQPGTSKNDQALMQRTLLDLSARGGNFMARVEFADMRQQLMDQDSVISTGIVNSLDILQAHVGYRWDNPGNTEVRVGRFTEDWGSRRLMARNRFRNTINAFEGVVAHHGLQDGGELRLMATQAVRRLPGDFNSLLNNDREADRSSGAQRFYGVHTDLPHLLSGIQTEAYLFRLQEKDTPAVATRNRRLNTLGLRLRRPPALSQFDFESETIVQSGKQRQSSAANDQQELDHFAWFQYLGLGYSFDHPWRPRLLLEFDYASGDADPNDQDSGRFDSLFGPTTFEFGVVGLYNPFNRSNLVTPGLRLSADPLPRINIMAIYRHFWLAQERDSWGRTGLRDVSGNTDSYLGQHLQLRLRWDVLPGNAQVESGAIFLQAEGLSDNNSEYVYAGVTLTF